MGVTGILFAALLLGLLGYKLSNQPTYLCELFTIHPSRSTRSSSCLTLSRPQSLLISCSPTEPYPSLHHVFGVTYHLNFAPFLYLHHRHCQSKDIHLLYPSPRAFHSKLKCHLFKLFYPDPSDDSPSPPE